MKTEAEWNAEIMKTTMHINRHFPELSKFILEMPVTIPNSTHPEINSKILSDYYDSLTALLDDYAITHKDDSI